MLDAAWEARCSCSSHASLQYGYSCDYIKFHANVRVLWQCKHSLCTVTLEISSKMNQRSTGISKCCASNCTVSTERWRYNMLLYVYLLNHASIYERFFQGRAVLTRLAKQCAHRWIYALLYTGIERRESKCCIPSLQAVPSPSQVFGRIRRALPDKIKCAAMPLRYAPLAGEDTSGSKMSNKGLAETSRPRHAR